MSPTSSSQLSAQIPAWHHGQYSVGPSCLDLVPEQSMEVSKHQQSWTMAQSKIEGYVEQHKVGIPAHIFETGSLFVRYAMFSYYWLIDSFMF